MVDGYKTIVIYTGPYNLLYRANQQEDKNMEQSITITEKELCETYHLKKVNTVKWVGTKGNRKIVVYGEPE